MIGLIQLKVKYKDNLLFDRTIIRVVTSNISDEWIDGWLSGVAEFVNYRGGSITSVDKEVVSEALYVDPSV